MEIVNPQECQCEQVDHGDLGRVGDEEKLARVVRSPRHYDPKVNRLKPGIFSFKEIKETGVSLIRADKISPPELLDIAMKIARHAGNGEFEGVGILKTHSVRNLRCSTETRCLCVKDDPILEAVPFPNPAHAVTEAARPLTDAEALEIQTELRNMLSDLLRPAQLLAY